MDVNIIITDPSERPTMSQSWICCNNVTIIYSVTRRGSFELSGVW